MTARLDEAPPGRAATRPRSGGGVYALLALLLVGVAAPLVAVLIQAVTGYDGRPSALGQLTESANLRIVGNTVLLGVLVVVIATVMAAPLAFLMSWTPLRRHRWIDIAVMVPFLTPPYVAAMAWLDFARVNGLAERWFGPFGAGLRAVVETPVGMAAIMACEIFTFLYLLLRNRLDTIPASADEMAAVAGASAGQRLRLVLAPLLTPAYALGALIVFIRAAGEFGTPVTLGNQIGFPVLVSEIYGNVTIDPLNFPRAAALSSLLLAMGMTVWGLQQWVSRRDIGFGGRAARRATVGTGRWTAAALLWPGLVLLVSVVVPYIAILLGAMTILRSKPPTPDNLTFDYFARVLRPGRGLEALQNSVVLAFIAATVTTVLAVACALVIVRRGRDAVPRARSAARRGVDLLGIAPDTVPTIVLVIGFIFFWNAPWLPVTPYNTRAMVVLAYVVITLPMALQQVKTAYAAIDDTLLEAAAAAGADTWQILRRITIPLLVPGIVAGWLLAFLLGVREVVASSMVRPSSLPLLSPWILGQFDQGHRAEAMAMTVIGVLSSTVVLVVLEWWRRRLTDRSTR
ncbi:ABC transporter permease subunit [Nocardia sp. NPDC004860]|uniref:ABC transporter permease n=1 Tax=Nocardia sp. NPDC004860 TaxID=3154557 RepID=UPI0033A63FFD